MDSFRGSFGFGSAYDEDAQGHEAPDEVLGQDAPPPSIGQDERRMQVRAYNHWASLLGNRQFPSVEDLDPENLPDFGPHSVLLDFTSGIENPGISYLGQALADECGHGDDIRQLSDIPGRSLLSRITDHYMQILANQAPIGFEAEFVNDRGATILYRGILLPFSSDDDTIDFIYGVINWKELADQLTTDALMQEIDAALNASKSADTQEDEAVMGAEEMPDAPLFNLLSRSHLSTPDAEEDDEDILDLGSLIKVGPRDFGPDLPDVGFGLFAEYAGEEVPGEPDTDLPPAFAELPADDAPETDAGLWTARMEGPELVSSDLPCLDEEPAEDTALAETPDAESMELGDWLASARELAWAAHANEDRTRQALYAAIGRAYDFALAAAGAPEDFAELLADAGLKRQDRAPMTPVVKLVFGADYDKTRLTEFAAALSHAQRLGLEQGSLAAYLAGTEGGLKAVVAAERKHRRAESGKDEAPVSRKREKLVSGLRALEARPLETIAHDGEEFALVMIRRMPDGAVAMLGEIADDEALVAAAARKLMA